MCHSLSQKLHRSEQVASNSTASEWEWLQGKAKGTIPKRAMSSLLLFSKDMRGQMLFDA